MHNCGNRLLEFEKNDMNLNPRNKLRPKSRPGYAIMIYKNRTARRAELRKSSRILAILRPARRLLDFWHAVLQRLQKSVDATALVAATCEKWPRTFGTRAVTK